MFKHASAQRHIMYYVGAHVLLSAEKYALQRCVCNMDSWKFSLTKAPYKLEILLEPQRC